MDELHDLIYNEAQKLVVRHERYARSLADEFTRRERRSLLPAKPKQVKRPAHWALADGFNPYLVRARSARIAHSIRRSISARTYRPRNAVLYQVPKDDGSTRTVSVFQTADKAVSRLIYTRLMARNRAKLSARSYAYRGDLTIHDAVQYMHAELDGEARIFIAEFDFTRFFESISHDHIRRVLRDGRFLVTPQESSVINAFMAVRSVEPTQYLPLGGTPRDTGVPLGTAISLFLANVAAWPLDRRLERLGVGYVRYADDTFMWSKNYAALTAALDALNEEVQRIGSSLNFAKSPGIRIMADELAQSSVEMTSTSSFTFVGHKFVRKPMPTSRITIGLSDRKRRAIQNRVDQFIYHNLLHEVLRGHQDLSRLGSVDRDYVVLIWQLRRFIYGRLSERQLRKMLYGGIHAIRLTGLLSYYPLIDDKDWLIELDSWIATRVWLSMRKRGTLLASIGATLPPPHYLPRDDLITYQYKSRSTGEVLDLRIPSSRRMAQLIMRATVIHGPNTIGRTDPTGY